MMSELSEYMPEIKKVLIDERDEYLAGSIWHSDGNSIVAVLGAGHLAGVKKHLENLGFVVGGDVSVISTLNGNVIVKIKETRVAISDEMARKIMV